jgi:hypothetical protein
MEEFKDECGRNCQYYWYESSRLRMKFKGSDVARKYSSAENKGTFHSNQTICRATIHYKLLVAKLVKKLPPLYNVTIHYRDQTSPTYNIPIETSL